MCQNLGPFNVTIKVRVMFVGLSLNGYGHRGDILVGSTNYTVMDYSRSLSSIPCVEYMELLG